MASRRNNFSRPIKEMLAKRAGYRCSNPECRIVTSGPHDDNGKAINIGVAAPSGPRFNSNFSPEERSDINNGIWLCQNCSKLIDNDTARFPEQVLVMWKRRHQEFIQAQMTAILKPEASSRTLGLLNVSAIFLQYSCTDLTCTLDIRVDNQGASDIMINAVELQVLECLQKMPLGNARFSAIYDLDVSKFAEYLSKAECPVAQLLNPGEADRFAIVVSASSLLLFSFWRFAARFKTNVGTIDGPEIEVNLPLPKELCSFCEAKQSIGGQVEKYIKARTPRYFPEGVVKVEPARLAGYKTSIAIGTNILFYYGPEPLVRVY